MECQWFLLCTNLATGVMSHPVCGDVPICDRCRKLTEKLQASVDRARIAMWESES